jgi:hypothetical protein
MRHLSIIVHDKYAVDCDITPRLCELVLERQRYHQEIEDEHGGVEFDNHCYNLNDLIHCELADMAGVDAEDISPNIQETCWWVEDRIEEEQEAA